MHACEVRYTPVTPVRRTPVRSFCTPEEIAFKRCSITKRRHFCHFLFFSGSIGSRMSCVRNCSSSKTSKYALTLFHHCFQSFSCLRIGRGGRSSFPRVSMPTKSVVSSVWRQCASSGGRSRVSHLSKASERFRGLKRGGHGGVKSVQR